MFEGAQNFCYLCFDMCVSEKVTIVEKAHDTNKIIPREKLWQIDAKLYDLTDFVNHHPGGKHTYEIYLCFKSACNPVEFFGRW